MSFSTMKDSDCRVRKVLTQFRWSDVDQLLGVQDAMNKAKVLAAVEEAKKTPLMKPYVKIGIVKSNLVFRIKHKDGHFGDKDIIIVKKYKDPAPIGENDGKVKQVLKPLKKATLSAGWWNEVRGEVPDTFGLEGLLTDIEMRLAALRSTRNLENFGNAMIALKAGESLAGEVMASFPHKADKAQLQHLIYRISKTTDLIESDSRVYREKLDEVVGRVRANIPNYFDQAQSALARFRNSLDQRNAESAPRDYARLLTAIKRAKGVRSEVTARIEGEVKNTVVDATDIDKNLFRNQIDGLVNELREVERQAKTDEARLDELLLAEDEEAVPGQDNEDYRKNFTEVLKNYRSVVNLSAPATAKLVKAEAAARGVAARATEPNVDLASLSQAMDKILNRLTQHRQIVLDEVDKVRNAGSEYVQDRMERGILPSDTERYLVPLINKALYLSQKSSTYVQSAKESLTEAVAALSDRFPEDNSIPEFTVRINALH